MDRTRLSLLARLVVLLVVLLLVLLLGACSSAPPTADPSPSPAPSGPASATPVDDPACAPAPGRTVELLPDVTAPAVEVPAVTDPDSGETLAEGFTLPEQTVDAGCVIRHEAPGGCLGAVEVTGVMIPEVVIPESTVGSRSYPAVTVPAVTQPGVQAPQVCQVTTEDDVPGVTRAGVVREGFSRDGAARPGDDEMPTVRVPPLRLPDVDVEPERLESRRLPDTTDVDVLEGEAGTSYVASSKVLFDTDRAVLRPAALAALRSIADTIGATAPGQRLLIEGHTDDQGSAEHGLTLSRQRAAAVADWFVDEGGFDRALVDEVGWGEEKPAYSNASEAGRQRNRRVVIMVLPPP